MDIETVCFIPCCSRKTARGITEIRTYRWPDKGLDNGWSRLLTARREIEYCIDSNSKATAAIHLYNGSFYSAFDVARARDLIYLGKSRLFIISAGYGVLDAFEMVHEYEAKMEGKVARYWRDAGLAGIIRDICVSLEPKQIYGFFAGQPSWSGAGAKYRYFYSEGVKEAISSGLKPYRAGCFYRKSGRGVGAILGALGRLFDCCLSRGLNCDDLPEAAKIGTLRDGGIVIEYDDLLPTEQCCV